VLNWAPRHEGVLRSGGISACILYLGTREVSGQLHAPGYLRSLYPVDNYRNQVSGDNIKELPLLRGQTAPISKHRVIKAHEGCGGKFYAFQSALLNERWMISFRLPPLYSGRGSKTSQCRAEGDDEDKVLAYCRKWISTTQPLESRLIVRAILTDS